MSSIKQYQNKNVVVKYHPDERVIHLRLKPKGASEGIYKLEDKIKTTLTVDSTTAKGPDQKMLVLSAQSQPSSVHEFLQTILQGGEETGDATDGEEDSAENQVQPPMPPQPGMQPGMPQPGMQPESFTVADAFRLLSENVNPFRFLREATYRTGEHWETVAQASGKGKQQIEDRDVLSLRKTYTKKKRSRSRDRVLRSLDRVSKYFARKIRNQVGEDAALLFKDRYKKIGTLTPLDYAEKEPGATASVESPEEQGFDPASVDFSEFFPKDRPGEDGVEGGGEDGRDDDDDDDDEETETPEEKYGEVPEEEYPN